MKKVLIIVLLSIATPYSVWGQAPPGDVKTYRDYSNGRTFLNVSGRFEVIDVGSIVVYSQPGFYKTAKKNFYYFSLTLDSSSSVFPLTWRQLRRVLDEEDEGTLIKKLKANRYRLAEKTGKHTLVNELLSDHKSHGFRTFGSREKINLAWSWL